MKELIKFLDKYNISYTVEGDYVIADNINLSNNQLTELPESFGNIKCNKLYNNKLTSLPESFGNLKCNNLYLSNNELTESIGNLKCNDLNTKMEGTIQTKFYEFNQNNSGGHFDVDENVCHRVIIEAMDRKHAIALFEPMIENQSGSCSCCGDRWLPEYADEIKLEEYKEKGYSVGVYSHYPDVEQRWFKLYGEFSRIEEPTWQTKYSSKEFSGKIYFETIEQYCQFMANACGWTIPDVRIHFMDGTKKEIFKCDAAS